MAEVKINDLNIVCNDDKTPTDLMWNLLRGAESIAINQLEIYRSGHSSNNELNVPLQPNGELFRLGLLYGKEFAFRKIIFDEEHNQLYFEGRFDDDAKDTVIYEEDLEPVHGILWLADYIINGIY